MYGQETYVFAWDHSKLFNFEDYELLLTTVNICSSPDSQSSLFQENAHQKWKGFMLRGSFDGWNRFREWRMGCVFTILRWNILLFIVTISTIIHTLTVLFISNPACASPSFLVPGVALTLMFLVTITAHQFLPAHRPRMALLSAAITRQFHHLHA